MSSTNAVTCASTPAFRYRSRVASTWPSPAWWRISNGRAARATAAGTERLSVSAPWLPPSTSTRRTALPAAMRLRGGERAVTAVRTGFPVVRSQPLPRWGNVPEKLSMIPVAIRDSTRLASPGNGVLLVYEKGPAQQPGGHPARSRHEPAHSDHHARTRANQDRGRLDEGHGHRGERHETRSAAKPAGGDEVKGELGRGNHPGLDSAPRPDPGHRPALLAQPGRHRQGGEHVAPGTAGEDAHPRAGHRPSAILVSRSIRTRSPRATQLATRLFPP